MSNPNRRILNDHSPMPFGKHQGKKMINVPADYLAWLADQPWLETKYPSVFAYIEENYDAIVMELEHRRNLGAG